MWYHSKSLIGASAPENASDTARWWTFRFETPFTCSRVECNTLAPLHPLILSSPMCMCRSSSSGTFCFSWFLYSSGALSNGSLSLGEALAHISTTRNAVHAATIVSSPYATIVCSLNSAISCLSYYEFSTHLSIAVAKCSDHHHRSQNNWITMLSLRRARRCRMD